MMNDKRNILGSLMPRHPQLQPQKRDKENSIVDLVQGEETSQQPAMKNTNNRPTSVGSSSVASAGRQHKLKQRFNVIRKLGKGTYGKVQLAINKETGQEVAIKTIKKTKIETEQDLQRVRREIQIMSSIEHPHIVHIYEVFENKDKIVLVMQYAPGGELYEHVSQAKVLDDNEARRLFRQIATAIYYCHENKICHRDLKLENILLDEKNNAKLADFGLSNVFDKRRQLKTFCGSPLYASPEIVQGSPYEGPEVDCWSLGVLLYTLVYGAMPFDGSNFKRLVKQISEACYFEPKQKSKASPLIRQLLCADPTKRATIIDICTDPWVNGTIPVSPVWQTERAEMGQQPVAQSTHHSLLKVAQDMANLTPVRFDILLALAPTSPNEGTQLNPDHKTPLAQLDVNQQVRVKSNNSNQKPARPKPNISLDPSVMEVNEERSTSPVANYVVRDLTPEPNTDAQVSYEKDLSNDIASVIVEGTDFNETEVDSTTDKDEKKLLVGEMEEADKIKDGQIEYSTVQCATSDMDPKEHQEDTEMVQDIREDESNMTVSIKQEEPSENFQSEIKIDATNASTESPTSSTRVPEQINMELDPSDLIKAESLNSSMDVAPIGESGPTLAGTNEESKKEDEIVEKSVEEKPKKVKKRVILVKKKKKVQNKPDTEGDSTEDKTKSDILLSDSTSTKRGNLDKQKVSSPKSPGKVKIPNTFQSTGDVDQKQGVESASPSDRIQQEARRPSALIADVSQKLLQQQGLISSSAATIRTDQPQLVNVKVSDKKSEFERRASLAVGTNQLGSYGTNRDASNHNPQVGFEEPQRLECMQESVKLLEELQQTILEPVDFKEPMQVSPAQQVSLKPLDDLVESQTPTGLENDRGTDPIQAAEMERRLAEWASRLGERKASDESRRSPGSPRDDRSDSVETIVAETSPVNRKSIRSSLQINLGEKQQPENKIPSTSPQTSLGPTPITRSYKKVIFTKDGACITETGKIYSTQGDDGAVRRIERKSKVTHYPADDNMNPSARAIEESEERLIAEDGGIAHVRQSTQSYSSSSLISNRRPFERLIMPSSGMMLMDDEEDDFFMKRTSFSPRHSTQIGRADSGSSCSSGSTDVFDDIFDTWTGTVSMFQKRPSLTKLHDSLINRAFGGDSIFRTMQRRRKVSSATAETARSGSVEPQYGYSGQKISSFGRSPSGEYSGYESDTQNERPASALSGARGVFGSGNLFPMNAEPAKSSNLLQDLEMEHERLRRKIASHHKQIWKGSTPSLFSGHNDSMSRVEQDQSNQRRKHKQPHGLWQFLRPEEALNNLDVSPKQSHSNSQQSGRVNQADVNDLNQSQSSNSFLRQSIALDASPMRRNTSILPPQPIRKNMNRSPLAKNQSSSSEINKNSESEQKHVTATFIELKRTTSSLGNQRDLQEQYQQVATKELHATNQRVLSNSGSSSAFWEGKLTPESSSLNVQPIDEQESLENQESRDNIDARVKDWLQESAGNLSNSSGCKSVASETAQAYNKNDTFSNLSTYIQTVKQRDSLSSKDLLPPISPSKSPIITGLQPADSTNNFTQVAHSTSSAMVVSLSKHSSSSICNQLNQHEPQEINKPMVIGSSSSRLEEDLKELSKDVTKATSGQRIQFEPDINVQQEKQVSSSTSITHNAVLATSTASITSKNAGGLIWTTQEEASSTNSRFLNDDFEDSLSGSGSGELESRSSSSLLDQLRSRGYRSMINQRIGGDSQEFRISAKDLGVTNPVESQLHSTQSSSSTEATSVVESSSRIISTSGSRIIHHQIQTTSSTTAVSRKNIEPNREQSDSGANVDKVDVLDNETEVVSSTSDSKQLAGNQEVGNFEQQVGEAKVKEKEEDDEDEDEDVKAAKMNIKAYKDRVKETELFLKSMQQEEEKTERQRKESFLLNNLVLSSKLNGFKMKPFGDCSLSSLGNINSGYRSAPVQTADFSSNRFSTAMDLNANTFIPSAALSFEPTVQMVPPYTNPCVQSGTSFDAPDQPSWKPVRDPLEPVKPLISGSSYCPQFRRARSQLSDQFESYKCSYRSPRATSPSIEHNEPIITTNSYLPSRKRSLSQIRTSYNSANTNDTSDTFSRTIGGGRGTMMSEYKSAYCNISHGDISMGNKSYLKVELTSRDVTSPVESLKTDGTDESDDGMNAYRVSTYFPKVVSIQPTPIRGRSYQRRSNTFSGSEPKQSGILDFSSQVDDEKRVRRVSLHSRKREEESVEPIETRRRSLTESSSGEQKNIINENSRLNELEQRIQANKKRREELLSGRVSPTPTSRDRKSSVSEEVTKREVSPAPNTSPRSSRLTRPSRLESMEARIKRKSYYVKPETSLYQQQSLEKWRQNLVSSNRRGSTSSPRNSICGLDPGNLLVNLERQQEVTKSAKEQADDE